MGPHGQQDLVLAIMIQVHLADCFSQIHRQRILVLKNNSLSGKIQCQMIVDTVLSGVDHIIVAGIPAKIPN